MFTSGFIVEELALRVGWALVHSLWQIALIGVLFAVVNRLLSRRSANLRYVAGCATLILMLIVPACWLVFTTIASSDRGAIEVASVSSRNVDRVDRTDIVRSSKNVPGNLNNEKDNHRAHVGNQTTISSNEIDESSLLSWHWIARLVAAAWFVGVLVLLIRPTLGFAHANQLLHVGRADVPEPVRLLACRIAEAMKVRRVVQVTESTLAQVPCVVGWFRPVIFLPASAVTGLSQAELESILAHEFAHIRRHDYIVNLGQMAIETLLFFHPAVWWVSRCVRREREYCCDDLALQICSDRTIYTDALLAVGGASVRSRFVLASDGTVLFQRIKRILEPNNNRVDTGSQRLKIRIAAVVCFMLFSVAIGSTFFLRSEETPLENNFEKETAMMSEPGEESPTTNDTTSSKQRQLSGKYLLPSHPFIQAVREVDLARVKELIAGDKTLVDSLVRGDVSLNGKVWKDGQHVDVKEDTPEHVGPLHFAAFHGLSELAQTLIDSGADINATASFGRKEGSTAVTVAAWEGNKETLKVILEAAKAAKIKLELKPALHAALIHLSREKADLLIEHGAQHDIYTAAMAGDGETLKRLIESNRESIDQKHSGYTRTPLEQALKVGQLEMAELLAQSGANVPAHAAAAMGRVDDVQALLKSDPQSATRQFGKQPLLIWALQCGQVKIVKLLLEHGADPNGSDKWDVSPLRHVAQVKGEAGKAIVDLLVAAGADIHQKSRGFTPIEWAVKMKNKHVHHRLLYYKQNWKITERESKFWKALGDGDLETVKACIKEEPSLASKRFPTGEGLFDLTDKLPLVRAAAHGHWEIVKLLLDHGVDPDGKLKDLEPSLGKEHRELGMPLIHAYRQGNYKMVHLLLDKGASVHAHPYCDHSFASVVYRDAAAAGAPTSMVLRSIPDLDEEDKKKIETIGEDVPEVIKLYDRILSLGAIPDHGAIAQAGDYDTVELLLRRHPTGDTKDYWGSNVHEALLYGSAWRGNAKVVEMCMEICANRHTTYAAQHCIRNAITSHNRPGSFEDYYRVIELNLDYLKAHDAFREHKWFLPLHCLADGYIKERTYGPCPEPPNVEQQIKLAKLCLEKGVDINHLTFDYKLTPLDHAINANQKEYAEFLRKNGGKESKDLLKK